jgi:hypothetical protein
MRLFLNERAEELSRRQRRRSGKLKKNKMQRLKNKTAICSAISLIAILIVVVFIFL